MLVLRRNSPCSCSKSPIAPPGLVSKNSSMFFATKLPTSGICLAAVWNMELLRLPATALSSSTDHILKASVSVAARSNLLRKHVSSRSAPESSVVVMLFRPKRTLYVLTKASSKATFVSRKAALPWTLLQASHCCSQCTKSLLRKRLKRKNLGNNRPHQ